MFKQDDLFSYKTAINMGPDQKHSHFREMKIRREVLTLKCN